MKKEKIVYDKFGCATIVLVDSSKLKTKENKCIPM